MRVRHHLYRKHHIPEEAPTHAEVSAGDLLQLTDQGREVRRRHGPRRRRSALVESLGGQIESFHFAFGGTDAYVVAELPTMSRPRQRL